MSKELAKKVAVDVVLSPIAPGVASIFELVSSLFDPDKCNTLEEQTRQHILDELVRLHRLLRERADQIRASGCTPEETLVIAHQVVEAQSRTLDQEKRAHLTNVLVNGLCESEWSKARHRLMVRCAAALESEHIEELRERSGQWLTRKERWPELTESQQSSRLAEWMAIRPALRHELLSLGLLAETPSSKVKHGTTRNPRTMAAWDNSAPVSDVEFKTAINISQLGRDFLRYLRDPAATATGEPAGDNDSDDTADTFKECELKRDP